MQCACKDTYCEQFNINSNESINANRKSFLLLNFSVDKTSEKKNIQTVQYFARFAKLTEFRNVTYVSIMYADRDVLLDK